MPPYRLPDVRSDPILYPTTNSRCEQERAPRGEQQDRHPNQTDSRELPRADLDVPRLASFTPQQRGERAPEQDEGADVGAEKKSEQLMLTTVGDSLECEVARQVVRDVARARTHAGGPQDTECTIAVAGCVAKQSVETVCAERRHEEEQSLHQDDQAPRQQ